MASAPKLDPGPQVTVYRRALLVFLLVGTIILLTPLVIWTFFDWFGNPEFAIVGTMGFAAAQLVLGIVGIVLVFKNGKGGKLR